MKAVSLYSIYEPNNLKLFSFYVKTIGKDYVDYLRTFEELKVVRIASGAGVWNINDRDYPVRDGDILLLSQADLRFFKEVTSDSPVKIEQIAFLPIALYPNMRCTEIFYDRTRNSPLVSRDADEFPVIENCFDRVRNEVTSSKRLKNERLISLLSELLILITRTMCTDDGGRVGEATHSTVNYKIICEAVAYINRSYAEDITLTNLSEKYHLSPAYFSRLFREFNGITLQKYISRCRIAHTIDLIKKEDKNVLEAAFACGFTSSSGFYKAFREYTGTTPHEFCKDKKG